ncbi:uncharacterized protein LOC129606620 isoform X3 [Condylostylus longicornis]|uniref:uncharacterized protein LOC129606620 isoform X3 n=1 Tax=Condylostylus longicornis TaxID=2530218 RepID=UPI00244DE685|nr:uncharacterized protein LOC129606620 isoform X3 [Condylostylus longicornis]
MANFYKAEEKKKIYFRSTHLPIELYTRFVADIHRETLIVFVYDTECCKEESDDPVDAVLYFHPSWVSDVQKLALCGQLMGMTYFLKTGLFKPEIIALQNGKFILKEFGRFILAVGTDRNISDSLLKHRAELLSSLIQFFHHDIQTIHDQFSSGSQFKNLSEKLYHIFETYLPILQHNGNIFHNVPKLKIPKSGSNIFLDAIQTLQSCQQRNGVLGGALLYHNKIVATQLSHSATKNLVLTDPYRIKSTAEQISVDFHVPNGVQMLIVYIPVSDYKKLVTESQRAQNLATQNLFSNTLPFQFNTKRNKIKRDKSIIFTNIPEEPTSASEFSTSSLTENSSTTSRDNKTTSSTTSTASAFSNPRSKSNLQRPTHLPLRFKNVTTKELPESGFVSINFDENDSYPEFIGRTSVCSTPMTENKILQGINILSICANPSENIIINNLKEERNKNFPNENNLVKKISSKIDFENFFKNVIPNPHKLERRNSLNDIQDSFKKISKRISLRPFGFGLAKIDTNKKKEELSREESFDNDDESSVKTISDPTYPMFNTKGEAISNGLFQEFLEKYNSSWQKNDKSESLSQLSDTSKNFKESKKKETEIDSDINQKENTEIKIINDIENDIISSRNNKSVSDRKSLSLPLKPLNDLDRLENSNNFSGYGTNGIFDAKRRKSGIQLTPLMAKLSILAANEESGFSSWDATPGIENQTPIDAPKLFRRKSSTKTDEIKPAAESFLSEEYQKVELYVCGQQNMTLFLILEEGSSRNRDLVQAMFDVCVARMGKLENQLNQTLNINVDGEKGEGSYSFICIDPKWDTLHRGGPWTPLDLIALEHMHKDLNMKFPITDMIMRTDESVIYGYKLGITEIFYKESTNQIGGLPPPSDLMGTISSRAKRRLERDHSYVLF